MSGDTVTGEALQFTNDNKHAYAYSGVIPVDNTEKALLNFSTNSEYINAIVQFNGGASGGGDNYNYRIKFNNVIIQEYVSNSNADDLYEELKIIIPPFTHVQCTAQNASDTSNNDQIVSLIGKVGMRQRVGDLDE
jgi:hypothetical protein